MKKYFMLIMVSIIVGFLLSFFVINQYKDGKGITVYKEGEELSFFKYGEYKSKEEMENDTITLENYIYKKDNDIYKVYIALTKNKDNIGKIKKYYDKYNLDVETFYIVDTDLIKKIENLDNILMTSNDNTVIGEIINQGLKCYEEDVSHDGTN